MKLLKFDIYFLFYDYFFFNLPIKSFWGAKLLSERLGGMTH